MNKNRQNLGKNCLEPRGTRKNHRARASAHWARAGNCLCAAKMTEKQTKIASKLHKNHAMEAKLRDDGCMDEKIYEQIHLPI